MYTHARRAYAWTSASSVQEVIVVRKFQVQMLLHLHIDTMTAVSDIAAARRSLRRPLLTGAYLANTCYAVCSNYAQR